MAASRAWGPLARSTSLVPWGQSSARTSSKSRALTTRPSFSRVMSVVELLRRGGDFRHRPGVQAQAVFHPEFLFYGPELGFVTCHCIMKSGLE